MPKGSLKNRKVLSSSSANRNTLKAEKEKEKDTSRGDQESSDLHMLLKAQSEKAHHKTWNRLDRGIRIQKVRQWARSKKDWPQEIIDKTETLLIKKLKMGGLSSSTSVSYNKKDGIIQNVPGIKLMYAIDISGNDTDTPIDVLYKENDRKNRRTAKT
jgi:hypothetical protein